jgi:hypothetical protein
MQCPKCGFWFPDPPPEACTRCGTPFQLDDRTGPPWESRTSGFDIQAIVETVKGVLFQPAVTFRSMRREGGIGGPLLYVVILGTISGWFAVLWNAFFQSLGFLAEGFGDQELLGLFGLVVVAVLMPIFVLIGTFISTAITHLCLFVVGGARRDFETTFRVLCYATGSTTLFMIVPACGGIVGFVWYIVVMILGLREAHEISTGRAAVAVLLPLIVCCVCGLWLIMAVFGIGFSQWLQNM